MGIESFRIEVPEETLDDLRRRLAATRWSDAVEGVGWEQGVPPDILRALCEYWRDGFDWRAKEAELNRFDHVRVTVDGVGLHAVRARGEGAAGGAAPRALVLTNGWPSCFLELLPVVPLLTRAGPDGPGFDVVVPSLPGFGFSDRPRAPGTNLSRAADLWVGLLDELGYERFGAHGSDLGAGVVSQLKARHPQRLTGAHTSNVYWEYAYDEAELTPVEREWHARGQQWFFQEGAYAHEQATKPQTLSYGLTDSPAGLAAWILEKWHAWSDGGLDAFNRDDLLATLTVYWATGTIGSSCRMYWETGRDPDLARSGQSAVPDGVIVFPGDMLPAPRAWGERVLNLQHWTEAPRGGHFPGLEAPEILAEDLRAFFRERD